MPPPKQKDDMALDDKAMKALERAEKQRNTRKEKAKEKPLDVQVRERLVHVTQHEPYERNLHDLSQALLFVGEVGKGTKLGDDVAVRMATLIKDHFTETVVVANALYATACIARSTIVFHERLWSVITKCVVAAVRFHQLDPLINSNGLYAIGKLCEQSFRLQQLIAETEGVDTILGSMRIHELDCVVQCNGCLALARLCDAEPPDEPSINEQDNQRAGTAKVVEDMYDEDGDAIAIVNPDAWRKEAVVSACAAQEQAIRMGVMDVLLKAYENHGEDPVVLSDLCEALASIGCGNTLLTEDEMVNFATKLTTVMRKDFHPTLLVRNRMPVPKEEQHGRDDLLVGFACKALSRMCLDRNTHLKAGDISGPPLLIPHPLKQYILTKCGSVQRMCEALQVFPKKKDTVLMQATGGLVTLIKQDLGGLQEMVKHRGQAFLLESMNRWYEDEEFHLLGLQCLLTLVQGTDGVRNIWYLETSKGREVAKFVVQGFQALAKKSADIKDAQVAQEMARTLLPDRKRQYGASTEDDTAAKPVAWLGLPEDMPEHMRPISGAASPGAAAIGGLGSAKGSGGGLSQVGSAKGAEGGGSSPVDGVVSAGGEAGAVKPFDRLDLG